MNSDTHHFIKEKKKEKKKKKKYCVQAGYLAAWQHAKNKK
jgi:hypothetical protein